MSLNASPHQRPVPAEWEPLANIWLAWPHKADSWPGRFKGIPDFYANWVRLIAESTPVKVLAVDEVARLCESKIAGVANCELVAIPTNDCWIRDYGPTFVECGHDQRLSGVSWSYNAWGGKYPPWDLDAQAASRIGRHLGIEIFQGNLCLEGGALESDGTGRLLVNPNCLITPTRNPGVSKEQLVQELYHQLGVTEIAWIDGGGLSGDDTDGHIDQLARFIDPATLVVSVSDDDTDENAAGLEENYRQLRLWGDVTNPRVSVHRLPIPPARRIDGSRVPESYCNFQRLGRERLLMPTFGAPSDDHAIGLLRELSGAEVTGIDCRDLAWGLGALHCASREQPKSR